MQIGLFRRFFVVLSILSLIFSLFTGYNQTEPAQELEPDVVELVKIVGCADTYACLDENGKVYVWGRWSYIPDDTPRVVDIALGQNHIVVLDENGKLHGWGSPEYGEIDFSDNLPKFIAIAAQGCQTTALTEDGRVYKWGNINGGSQQYVPKNMGKVVQIANGIYNTAVITEDNKTFMWGITNSYPPFCKEPLMLAPLSYDLAVLGKDGKVYGDVVHYDMNSLYKEKPQLGKIVKLFGGAQNLAAIDENGRVEIWGEYNVNNNGQTLVNTPKNLPKITGVAFGYNTVACIGEDGKVYQWGDTYRQVPYEINGFGDISPEFDNLIDTSRNYEIDVYSSNEFYKALQLKYKRITVKNNIEISGDAYINNSVTMIIDKGVKVTVNSMNFVIHGSIINNGDINIFGRIMFYNERSQFGNINSMNYGSIVYCCGYAYLYEIEKYLGADSIYDSLAVVSGNTCNIIIDKNYTLPVEKSLWLNMNCTLVVSEGVTLTIYGQLETHNKPIINGKVIGNIIENK